MLLLYLFTNWLNWVRFSVSEDYTSEQAFLSEDLCFFKCCAVRMDLKVYQTFARHSKRWFGLTFKNLLMYLHLHTTDKQIPFNLYQSEYTQNVCVCVCLCLCVCVCLEGFQRISYLVVMLIATQERLKEQRIQINVFIPLFSSISIKKRKGSLVQLCMYFDINLKPQLMYFQHITCYLLDALIQSDLHTQYCGQSPQEHFGVKCLRDTTTCWLQWGLNLCSLDPNTKALSTAPHA